MLDMCTGVEEQRHVIRPMLAHERECHVRQQAIEKRRLGPFVLRRHPEDPQIFRDRSRRKIGQRERQELRAELRDREIARCVGVDDLANQRSEEHTSELQSLMRISYAGFCLKKKKKKRDRYEQ